MRIPLVLGAEPKKFSNNARIALLVGKWKIICEGVKDTLLNLHLSTLVEPVKLTDIPILIDGGCYAKISILKPGTEQHFSVFAEKQTE